MAKNVTKRKRCAKTSAEQYGEYLKVMEEDSIFRSGTINPTVDPNYINNKWETLSQKLNSCGSGPELTAGEWKKRFNDWKNATRAKYRKIVEHSKQTGGGPATDTTLTPLEDRGLTVWGKVAVTGTPKVLVVGGLQTWQPVENAEITVLDIAENSEAETTDVYCNNSESLESLAQEPLSERGIYRPPNTLEHDQASTSKEAEIMTPKSLTMSLFDKIRLNKKQKQKNVAAEVRSLSVISEEFLSLYKENINTENANVVLEEKKLNLEYNKFKFEVAKYKFENPGFEFEIEEFCH